MRTVVGFAERKYHFRDPFFDPRGFGDGGIMIDGFDSVNSAVEKNDKTLFPSNSPVIMSVVQNTGEQSSLRHTRNKICPVDDQRGESVLRTEWRRASELSIL